MALSLKDITQAAERDVTRIDISEAQRLLETGEAVPIDVREEAEFKTLPRLADAVSIPRSHLEFKCDPASPNFEPALDTGKTLLVYCRSGGRALLAAKTMTDMGVTNVRLLGGIQDWMAKGGDVED